MALVATEVRDGVATLTLTDPGRRNAIGLPMAREMVEAIDGLDPAEVGALVITGEGPAFCAGADLSVLEMADESALTELYESFNCVLRSHLPSIAAVNGAAVGAGMNLALACDLVLASERARFHTGFLRLNVLPGGGHTWMLSRAIGPRGASAMTLFQDSLDGREAERVGLAWRCVPDDELLCLAQDLAGRAAARPRALIERLSRTLDWVAGPVDRAEALRYELEHQLWSLQQAEARGAIEAVRSEISRSSG